MSVGGCVLTGLAILKIVRTYESGSDTLIFVAPLQSVHSIWCLPSRQELHCWQ